MGSTGSTGQGWDLARQLGHSVTDVFPALVPLVLDESFFHAAVTGVSQEAELSVFVSGKRIEQRTGSLLWTHTGISGPVVLDVSRHWGAARLAGRPVDIRCNFLPGESFEQVEQWLTEQGRSPHRLVDSVIASRLPRRLAERLVRFCGITDDVRAGRLRREDRRHLVHVLTELPLPITGNRGWDLAEVTAGGVPLQEIDYRTMESRKCPGLYLAGEMLDCDGPVGGYNLQWAWSTGTIAGRAAAKGLAEAAGHVA
jgi:predicted Rossmann fold flavoprotein